MDFRNFKSNRKPLQDKEETSEDNIRRTAEKYANKSEDELLAEIMRLATENKRNGSLSEAQFDEFERNVMPMLNAEQRKRMESVLKMLKR